MNRYTVAVLVNNQFGVLNRVTSMFRSVRVTILEGVVTVDLSLNIEYGRNILETSKKVQEKVKSAIENMTGLEVADVNIHIASVDMENEKGK